MPKNKKQTDTLPLITREQYSIDLLKELIGTDLLQCTCPDNKRCSGQCLRAKVQRVIKRVPKKNRYPRRCDITGKPFWEGYCFADGEHYAKDEASAKLLAKMYGYDSLEAAYAADVYYFSEWPELDDDGYFTVDGYWVDIDPDNPE